MIQLPDNSNFPLDSLIIYENGKIVKEEYAYPYGEKVLHRMFSAAKSYTSLAVGALFAEGKTDLDTAITEYFPEYAKLPGFEALKNTSVRNLLMMQTPFAKTTYKIIQTDDWVRSFFEAEADHKSGMVFQYDTSAAVVLGALVKKISGLGVLDYLREVFLSEIGFSKEAYMLPTPLNAEHTGSGLMAYPRDLFCTGKFLLAVLRGDFFKEYANLIKENRFDEAFWNRYTRYLKDAMSYQSATVHAGKTRSERYGYGYQFWMLPKGGVMMYGMGGQYLLLYPKQNLILVTTADTQSAQGGTQIILDSAEKLAAGAPGNSHSNALENDDSEGSASENNSIDVNVPEKNAKHLTGNFRITKNNSPFQSFTLSGEELLLSGSAQNYRIPFSVDAYGPVEKWNAEIEICACAKPQADGSLYIHARLVGECLGAIHILVREKDNDAMLYLRKVEETALPEFNGFFDAKRI